MGGAMWLAVLGLVLATLACTLLPWEERRRCGAPARTRAVLAWSGIGAGAAMALVSLQPAA